MIAAPARPHSSADAALVEEARNGSQEALDRLWRDYEPRAYRFALQLCKTPDLAADLVSEGFARAMGSLPSYRGTSTFGTWLTSIIRNCYLDGYRRATRFPTISLSHHAESGETVMLEFEAHDALPDDECQRSEFRFLVDRAVAKLPQHQRACVELYYFEALGVDEVASALGLPVGTVKTRLHRARQSLRQTLWYFGESEDALKEAA